MRTLFIVLGLMVCGANFSIANAQVPTPLPMCPIDNALTASFVSPRENKQATTVMRESIAIRNSSAYTMQGHTLAVAWYGQEGSLAYFTVVADDVALAPEEQTVVPVAIDVQALLPGQYTMKPFLVPGDAVAVLGHLTMGKAGPGTLFFKAGEAVPTITLELLVNGTSPQSTQVAPGQALTVSALTTNTASTPLLNGKTVVALSQGNIPLGEAVRISVADSIKLFPGSKRTTSLFEPFVGTGPHTLTAGVFIPNVAQPIIAQSFQVGEGTDTRSFSYLSALGIGSYSDEMGVPVVACVEDTNTDRSRGGEALEIRVDDYIQQIDTLPRDAAGATFTLPQVSGEAAVTIALLSPRERARASSQSEAEALANDGLVPVQTISFMPQCERFDICISQLADSAGDFVHEPLFKTSVWFYLGIMLAALLLQLVILQRLPSRSAKKVPMTKPTK